MKALLITTLIMGFISVNSVSAAQEINHADGKEKIGVVSASNAYTLDELSDVLSGYTGLLKSISKSLASRTGCVTALL